MGRRRNERRIAAAAGRRVKLDLFAEPSGDLAAQSEVGGDDDDTKIQVGLSNSPSSSGIIDGNLESAMVFFLLRFVCLWLMSVYGILMMVAQCLTGKQPEDPLALLGQYSDDESDGHSSGSSGEQRRAVVQDFIDTLDKPLSTAQRTGSSAMKEMNGYTSQNGEQPAMKTSLALIEKVQKTEDSHPTEDNVTIPVVMMQENDIGKENSNPASDAQETEDVISGWKIVLHEESNQHYYWNVATGETSWEIPDVLAQQTNFTFGNKDSVINENMETAYIDEKLKHSEAEDLVDDKDGVLVQSCENGSFPLINEPNAASSSRSDDFSGEACDDAQVESFELVHGQDYQGEKHLHTYLLDHYERLLEKVNFVEGYKSKVHEHDQMLKNSWEIEIRLADIKSLASYGSSLTPYWEYCKGRFLQLEASVNAVLTCLKGTELDAVNVSHETRANSSDHKEENMCSKELACALGDLIASESARKTVVSKKYPETASKVKTESDRIARHIESTTETLFHSDEDLDMDVDMEVEDSSPFSMSVDPLQVPLEKLNQPNIVSNLEPSVHEQSVSIPPAPDDEWVPPPPPPPDTEQIPPPPPDENFESMTQQSSDLASVQSFSYPDHFSYSNPHFQYYGQGDTDNSSLYANAEVYQQTVSHPTLYYEASAESYGPTLAINHVLPNIYFDVQDSTLQPSHDSYGVSGEHVVGSVSSIPESKVNASTIAREASGISLGISHSVAPIQEPATVLASETVPVSSVPIVTVSAPAAKGQSKVVRPKKRTVAAVSSMRSNKKVSSLVDKWKAAKEELEEEQEIEPKNAYEKLEMKRHRAIEEWRAQQIASGEAKDNANFQPLGGDWRERVKRKRAQLANESSSLSPSDVEGKQQPDLIELSKGLPPSWQVYWDDSSKQVYYANTVTLETTWIRPTN